MIPMRRVIVAAAAVLLFMVPACGDDDGAETMVEIVDRAESGVVVTGVGEVYGVPDTMTVTVGVSVTRDTVAEAADQAARSASAVIDSLEDAGVDDADIRTQRFSIQPEYDWERDGREFIGFTVTNTVVAQIRDIDRAGETIDAVVVAAGDDTVVKGVGFSVEDEAERLSEARLRAWEDAEAKARELADLAGVELGDAVLIAEDIGTVSTPRVAVSADLGGAAATPIEPGEIASTVTLTVRFALGGA
jgi:uncharacterized protein YggE